MIFFEGPEFGGWEVLVLGGQVDDMSDLSGISAWEEEDCHVFDPWQKASSICGHVLEHELDVIGDWRIP